MADGNLRRFQLGNGFERSASTEHVKRVQDRGGLLMPGLFHNFQRVFDRVELLHETQKLHRRLDSHRTTDLQQFAIVSSPQFIVGQARGRRSDDMGRAQGNGLGHATFALVQGLAITFPCGVKPVRQINSRGNGQSMVIECVADVFDRPTLGDVLVQFVMPKFDRHISSLGRRLDLGDDRNGANCATVQAIKKNGHKKFSTKNLCSSNGSSSTRLVRAREQPLRQPATTVDLGTNLRPAELSAKPAVNIRQTRGVSTLSTPKRPGKVLIATRCSTPSANIHIQSRFHVLKLRYYQQSQATKNTISNLPCWPPERAGSLRRNSRMWHFVV